MFSQQMLKRGNERFESGGKKEWVYNLQKAKCKFKKEAIFLWYALVKYKIRYVGFMEKMSLYIISVASD